MIGPVGIEPHVGPYPSGGFSFAPSDLDNLAAWYKADAITGLTDGVSVAQWDDSSGNARHVTQGTASKQPVYKTGILNGEPVVRFDGTDDFLFKSFTATFTQPYTIFVVGKSTANAGYFFDGGLSDQALIARSAGGTFIANSGTSLVGPTADASVHLFAAEFNGASGKFWMDGALVASGAIGSNSLTGLTIGSRRNGANALNGDYAELICYSDALSSAERLSLDHYIFHKYGLLGT